MDVITAGHLIAVQRQACGLSQARLAGLCGISRQALNEIERGAAPHARAATVFRVMDALGVSFDAPRARTRDWIGMATRSAATRYRDPPGRDAVVAGLASGEIAAAFRPHLRQILAETPAIALPSLVRQLSSETRLPPKSIWKALDRLSAELGVDRLGREIAT